MQSSLPLRASAAHGASPDDAPGRPLLLKTGALQDAILNSANFCSIATDERGVIQVFNVGCERMLGYAAEDVVNRITPAELSDPQELLQRAAALSQEFGAPIAPGFDALVFKASRGIEDIYELTCLRQDGSRLPALVSVTALLDQQQARIGYLMICTDNTARRQIEAEQARLDHALRESNAELQRAREQADRANHAKSQFLSNMSHELRSPLNAILGFAQLIDSGRPPPTPDQKDSVDQILRAGWYLLALINEILDLALIESGRLSLSREPVALNELLLDCQAMVEPQARQHGIALHMEPPELTLFVQADRTRLKQIFVNLLSNAIKYNRVGGRVDVSCSLQPGERVRIGFRDTGQGLSAEMLAQLFQPFNRLGQESGDVEGTGIGLTVSKQLTELMGGTIGADSTLGEGSVFWVEIAIAGAFDLPAIGVPSEVPALDAAQQPGRAVRTVLSVEDNPANLLLVARLLERRPDLRLISARDGRSGIALAHAEKPDVILMDINLPGISGLTALGLLAADPATAQIPVVALSANAMPHDVARGLAAGFFRYLTKPIRVDEFMETLDRALESRAGPRDQTTPGETD